MRDCASHLTLSVVHDRGPGPDIKHFCAALDQAQRRLPLEVLLADAGYDELYVANMGPHHQQMIEFYGREVLPQLA